LRKIPFSDERDVARSPKSGEEEVTFRVSRGIGISFSRPGKSGPNQENFVFLYTGDDRAHHLGAVNFTPYQRRI
jgi:hypothetical protein